MEVIISLRVVYFIMVRSPYDQWVIVPGGQPICSTCEQVCCNTLFGRTPKQHHEINELRNYLCSLRNSRFAVFFNISIRKNNDRIDAITVKFDSAYQCICIL